jgi:hypothetical protein
MRAAPRYRLTEEDVRLETWRRRVLAVLEPLPAPGVAEALIEDRRRELAGERAWVRPCVPGEFPGAAECRVKVLGPGRRVRRYYAAGVE